MKVIIYRGEMKWIHWTFCIIYLLSALYFGSIEIHTGFLHFRQAPFLTSLIVAGGTCVWALFYLFAQIVYLVTLEEEE